MDVSIFPKKEEWGSGDEAMDNRLSIALKKTIDHISIDSISEFYFFGLSQKPRAYNPTFHTNIEFVTKALVALMNADDYNDQVMQKIKGRYYGRQKRDLHLVEFEEILSTLKRDKIFRYKNQLDLYLRIQDTEERNPFLRVPLKRSPIELHAKIIMKDFRLWLNGEKEMKMAPDSLFDNLKTQDILDIKNFAEVWFHDGVIYMLMKGDVG